MTTLEKLELIRKAMMELYPGIAKISADIGLLNEAECVLQDWIKEERIKKIKDKE